MRTLHAALLAAFAVGLSNAVPASAQTPGWEKVAEALGKIGTEMPGGVYRVGLPRTDLNVLLDGVQLKPSLALGSWLAFQGMGGGKAMVMGDLVLTESEITPVLSKLTEGDIQITALHNHLFRASPARFYMHVLGEGGPGQTCHCFA